MPAAGQLEKLKILAFTEPDYSGEAIATFEAFLNPAEITLGFEIEFDTSQGAGTTGGRMEFKTIKPGDLSLAVFVDGTGADGRGPVDVRAKVAEFQTVTGYNGDIHRVNYLKVMWGTLSVKRCVLKSVSITYKLFAPNGVPMRALITAVFLDQSDDATRVAMADDRSADLTHIRIVKAGDTLPGLCQKIYGDPFRYLQVAGDNGLDQFRRLEPGTKLRFRPLKVLS